MTDNVRSSSRLRHALAALVLLAATSVGAAAQMMPGAGATNVDAEGLALKGYDPVAYQTAMTPTMGSADITATHEGATYRFASAENRDRFMSEPAKYAPMYGGFCAFGVVGGKKFDIDPAAFTVVDGKLYMNKNLDVRASWAKSIPRNNARADRNWPEVVKLAGFSK